MVSTYTPNLRLNEQGTNDNPNTWGTILNQQVISLIESAVAGVGSINVTGVSNVTLTTANGATDQARNAVLELTGTLGANIQVIVPAVQKLYLVRGAWTNSGGPWTVTVIPVGGSSGVSLSTGSSLLVYTNGINIYQLGVTGNLLATNNLSDLTNATQAVANLGLTIGSKTQAWSPILDQLSLGAGNVTTNATQLGFLPAAYTAMGTGANNIVQLNGSAQLPAIDGSLLNIAANPHAVTSITNNISGGIVLGPIRIQWGFVALAQSPPVTYPVAFSATPYNIQVTSLTNATYVLPRLITSTGFATTTAQTDEQGPVPASFNWIAIGPT